MSGRQETTGRYCLPVNPEQSLTAHPAFRYAVGIYLVGLAAMFASGIPQLSLTGSQRTALQAVFMLCSLGYLAITSWIRHRGGNRRPPDTARDTAG